MSDETSSPGRGPSAARGLLLGLAVCATALVIGPRAAPEAGALPQSAQRLEIAVAGQAGVPADAAAVVMNVTSTNSLGDGYVTVWPCDEPKPPASNLNYQRRSDIANLVISRIGAAGTVCLEASADTDLLADVTGYFPTGSSFSTLASPVRLFDTRTGTAMPAGRQVGIRAAGRDGIPDDARGVVLNVTVTRSRDAGYLTVFPCGQSRPETSNLNYTTGRDIANLAIAPVVDGDVCIYTSTDTDVIVDASGYLRDTATFEPTTPARMLDTRSGIGAAAQPLGADAGITLDVAGYSGVPADATAVALTLTATGSGAAGFVSVWPCGPRPDTSNLNFTHGRDQANVVVVPLSPDGQLCLSSSAPTHLIADVAGFFPAGSDFRMVETATRLLDTRTPPIPSAVQQPEGRALRVMFVGDSIGLYLGENAIQQAAALGVSVQNRAVGACPLADQRIRRRHVTGAIMTFPDPCPYVVQAYGSAVHASRPDVVIMAFAATMLDENEVAPGVWAAPCTTLFDAWFYGQIARSASALASAGAAVYWATAAYYRAEVNDHTPALDDQIDCLNDIALQVAADSHGALGILQLGAWTCPTRECLAERTGQVLRADGSHYRDGGAFAANAWMLDQIIE